MSIKGVIQTIKNEAKEQKDVFLSNLLGTLGASLVGNLSTAKELKRSRFFCRRSVKTPGRGVMRVGEYKIRAKQDF